MRKRTFIGVSVLCIVFSLIFSALSQGGFGPQCTTGAKNKNSNSNRLFLARVSGKGASVSQRVGGFLVFLFFPHCFPPRAV